MKYNNDYVRPCALEELIRQEKIDHIRDVKLGMPSYDGAVIVPGSIERAGGLYVGGRYVPLSSVDGRVAEHYVGEYSSIEEDVLFLGMIFGTWGHLLTDFLARVWPFLRPVAGSIPRKIAFITSNSDMKIPSNYFEMLSALGIENERIVQIREPTRFAKVVFPDLSFWRDAEMRARFCSGEYCETIECIRSHFMQESVAPFRRLYFTRSGWKKGSVDFGEELVERAFEKHKGCEIVHPERLSFKEMMKLLSECNLFVTTEGSTAHNSLFLSKGTEVVIVRKDDYVNGFQPVVNQVRDLNVTYVDANGTRLYRSPKEPWFGPFFLFVNEYLASYLNCKQSGVEKVVPFLKYFRCFLVWRTRIALSAVKWFLIRRYRAVVVRRKGACDA